jgi:hypothetical protein
VIQASCGLRWTGAAGAGPVDVLCLVMGRPLGAPGMGDGRCGREVYLTNSWIFVDNAFASAVSDRTRWSRASSHGFTLVV